MRKFLLLCYIISLPSGIFAQQFKLFNIDISGYPVIQANFTITDDLNQPVTNAGIDDFSVMENSRKGKIIEVANPTKGGNPVSVVLVFDVSSSMRGNRIELAKSAARDFVRKISLENSEIAIASFSDHVYVNSDFTQSQQRLFTTIDNIQVGGGTSYDEAFLFDPDGAIEVAKEGRYRRIIIFLTDGLSTTDASEVIRKAKEYNITVYSVTIGLHIPEVLKEISTETNGRYFETITDISQLNIIYSMIFQYLQTTEYGVIRWRAVNDCQASKVGRMSYHNLNFDFDYEIPEKKLGFIDVDPSQMSFGPVLPGTEVKRWLVLKANTESFTIKKIEISKNTAFSLTDSVPVPFILFPGEMTRVAVKFKPPETGRINATLKIANSECPDKKVELVGGYDERLKLIRPVGGEVFVAGTDTVIRWKGVRKSKMVALSYRKDSLSKWIGIGDTSGLQKSWVIPADTGSHFQVKALPLPGIDDKWNLKWIVDKPVPILQSAYFTPNDSLMATTDNYGNCMIWNLKLGRSEQSLEGFRAEAAILSDDCNKLISFSRTDILVWDLSARKLISKTVLQGKIVKTTYIFSADDNVYTSANIYSDPAGGVKILEPEFDFHAFIRSPVRIRSASFTPDGLRLVTFDAENNLKVLDVKSGEVIAESKLPQGVTSVIVDPSGRSALVVQSNKLTMIDLQTGSDLFQLTGLKFQKFNKSGDLFTALDAVGNVCFVDGRTGSVHMKISKPYFYQLFPEGQNIIYGKGREVYCIDVATKAEIFKFTNNTISSVLLGGDGNKVITLRNGNTTIEMFDIKNRSSVVTLDAFDKPVRTVFLSPSGNLLLAITNDYIMQTWSPISDVPLKEDVSGYFSIISPKPVVKKEISFDDQFTNASTEQVVDDMITNPTKYPLKISAMVWTDSSSGCFQKVSDNFPVVLKAGESYPVEFRFTPDSVGMHKTRIMTITPTDTFYTTFSGNGIKKVVDFTGTTINFGRIPVFQHRDSLVNILRNVSADTLFVTGLYQTGPDKRQFKLLKNTGDFVVPPGDTLKAKISFSPVERGRTSGSISLHCKGVPELPGVLLLGEGLASRTVFVKGRTLIDRDSTPTSAFVKVSDLESFRTMDTISTNSSGKFGFVLSADRNYGISAQKKGFISGSSNIDLEEATLTDTVYRDIYLSQLENGTLVKFQCIFFEFAKADLRPTSMNDLNRMVIFLRENPKWKVEVIGHTDSIGSDEDNLLLSRNRALAVKNYLVLKGIPASRLGIQFFGESRPVATNSTDEGRQQNRRVEFRFETLGIKQ